MSERNETGTGWPEGEPADVAPTPSTVDDEAAERTGADDGASDRFEDEDAAYHAEQAVPDGSGEGAGRPGLARRVSAAGAMIGLLLGLLGFALVVQLRSHSDPQLASARPEDLVRILSDLDARENRLRSEITSLEDNQRQLQSGA